MAQPEKTETRRLAAGDWAIVVGTSPTFPGLGKIVDGEYDPADNALVLARLEFARGTRAFFPGDLARVEPEDEARVCESALARGLLSSEEADRLRPFVDAFRRGETRFVRSPGLLDRLWAFLPDEPKRGESPRGLVAFFDDGPGALVPPPSAPPPEAPAVPVVRPLEVATPRKTTDAPRTPARSLAPPGEVLARILGTLNHTVLRRVAETTGTVFPQGTFSLAREMRDALLAARVPLPVVLFALSTNQLRVAWREVGMHVSEALDLVSDDEIRELILVLAANDPA